MKVKRICWVGTRTDAFDETTAFFRDVLGLPLVLSVPGFSMLQFPGADRDYVEVFAADSSLFPFYTTGPVAAFLVDDVEEARSELEAAGVELIGSVEWAQTMEGYGWINFRGPDGNVYALVQGADGEPAKAQTPTT